MGKEGFTPEPVAEEEKVLEVPVVEEFKIPESLQLYLDDMIGIGKDLEGLKEELDTFKTKDELKAKLTKLLRSKKISKREKKEMLDLVGGEDYEHIETAVELAMKATDKYVGEEVEEETEEENEEEPAVAQDKKEEAQVDIPNSPDGNSKDESIVTPEVTPTVEEHSSKQENNNDSAQNTNESLEKPKPVSFTTAKGSVYTYLPDGRTQRFKEATGESLDPQDVCVFLPPYEEIYAEAKKRFPEIFAEVDNHILFKQLILDYQNRDGLTIRVTDSKGNEITTNDQLTNVGEVYMYFIDKNNSKNNFYLPVSKEPKIGYNTFDTRIYKEDGQTKKERHLGNKVVDIKYSS